MGWDGFADPVVLNNNFIEERLQEFGIDITSNLNYHISKQSMVSATQSKNKPFEVWAISKTNGLDNNDIKTVDCRLFLFKDGSNSRLRFGQKGHWIWTDFYLEDCPYYYNCPPSYIKTWIDILGENWRTKDSALSYITQWLCCWKHKSQIEIKLEFGKRDLWLEDYNYIQYIYDPQLSAKYFK